MNFGKLFISVGTDYAKTTENSGRDSALHANAAQTGVKGLFPDPYNQPADMHNTAAHRFWTLGHSDARRCQ
jgi:hypothetical protein